MKRLALTILLIVALAAPAPAYILAGVLSSYHAPTAPNAPTGVSATAGNGQNTVSWTASAVDGSHDAATSYNLLWGTSAGSEPNTITGVTSGYVHSSLTGGQPYYYKVQAQNAVGTANSSEVSATPISVLSDEFAGNNGDAYSSSNWLAGKVQTDGTATSGTYVNIQSNALKFHQAYATGNLYGTHVVSANNYPTASPQSVEVSVTGMMSDASGTGQSNLINVYGAGCTIGSNGSVDKDYLSFRMGPGTAADSKVTLYFSSLDDSGTPYSSELNTNVAWDSSPHTYKIVFNTTGTVTAYMDGVQQGTTFTHHVTWGANMRFGMSYYAYGVSANSFQDFSVDYYRVQ